MFTLRREGKFFGTPTGCCHCGPDNEPREYEYAYAITVYNFGLDESGFVLDNRAPEAWFKEHCGEGFSESCELLARTAAYQFASMCKRPYQITVCITGFETARAEFSFYCESLPVRAVRMVLDYVWSRYAGLVPVSVWVKVQYFLDRCTDTVGFFWEKLL